MSALPVDTSTYAAQAYPVIRQYQPPPGQGEAIVSALLRGALRVGLKPFLGPPWPFAMQRLALALGSSVMPRDKRAQVRADQIGHIPVERVTPVAQGARKLRHAILYLHGGAFVAGSPRTHRSITTYLAASTGALVLAPDYRLAPEAPFPAQLEDCVAAYRQLLKEGFSPEHIAIAGDSAGACLTLMTAIAAAREGLPAPAALVMMSPALSLHPLPNSTVPQRDARDPMIRLSWGEDVERAMRVPPDHPYANAMAQDYSRLPPSLIQVGDDEVLYDNAVWLVEAVTAAGRTTELEIYLKRWHVFQVHGALLASATKAMDRQVAFIKRHWAA